MMIDYDEIEEQKLKNKKLKRIIIISIIILSILSAILIALIYYKIENPSFITTYIDGEKVQNFDRIIDIQTDENGETQFYIPIRTFATYLNEVKKYGYEDFDGEYDIKTEDKNSCHILRDKFEVVVYNKGSKTIYKKNLQNNSNEYEEYTIDKDVFANNGVLYASKEGIEQGYNVNISYEPKKKIIRIYTLDFLVQKQIERFSKEPFGNYGTLEYDEIDKEFNNAKSMFEDVLIVKTENKQYGILSGDHKTFVLEPKYDKITYIPDSQSFLVESDGKVGLFTKDGEQRIGLIYEEIISIGKNSNLYVVKSNNLYGVVDVNKNESNNIIIYPQYNQIGIDTKDFAYNGIKNGYILLDELIPVKQDKLWALYNKKGERVSDGFKYTNIGCSKIKRGNGIFPLLQIPEVKVVVVEDQANKYGFMDLKGNELLPFVLEQVYIKTSNGVDSYWMSYTVNEEEKELNVLDYLKQKN